MRKIFITIAVLSVLQSLFLTGCSRKVINGKTKEQTEQTATQTATISSNSSDKTNINILTESDELEFIPIDNTKPVIINGKSYFNARIKAVKSKTNTIAASEKKESKNVLIVAKTQNKAITAVKTKETEKKDYSGLYLMGIALVLTALYLYVKFKYL
jgi:preprotein translocase subunit SecF